MKSKTKIFLVDDDPIFMLLARKIISMAAPATDVQPFYNGLDAVSYIEKNMNNKKLLPDIILLDLSMPIMDGWGFLNEYSIILPFLRKRPLLYILSSSISPDDVERARKMSIVEDYLVKPLAKRQFQDLFDSSKVSLSAVAELN